SWRRSSAPTGSPRCACGRTRRSTSTTGDPMVELTRVYHFSAGHRLENPALSARANAALYGPCHRPHGHNYYLEVTVAGVPDQLTGMSVDLGQIDGAVTERVLSRVDHQTLEEVPELAGVVTTGEIGRASCRERVHVLAEDGIRDLIVTGVQTCALPIWPVSPAPRAQLLPGSHRGRRPRPADRHVGGPRPDRRRGDRARAEPRGPSDARRGAGAGRCRHDRRGARARVLAPPGAGGPGRRAPARHGGGDRQESIPVRR